MDDAATGEDQRTVGEVARLSGVSVRTLHHYDEIGLVQPSGRSEAGYRLYAGADLARLRQVLVYRELEIGLEDIAAILDGSGEAGGAPVPAEADGETRRAAGHLRRQHRLLRERRDRAGELIEAIEHELEAADQGLALTPEEQFELFGTRELERHQDEARERWGSTDAWRQSRRRAAAYTEEDWVAIKAEAEANVQGFAEAIRAGEPADGPVARRLAEEHRRHLTRWFYDCGPEMHRGLAELYVSDPRYHEEWDAVAPGFSRYVHDAIHANASASA